MRVAVLDPAWTIGPGTFGPINVDMTATVAKATGLAVPQDPGAPCNVQWAAAPSVEALGVHLVFSSDTLDAVSVGSAQVGTVEGIHVGSTVADLDAAYGDALKQLRYSNAKRTLHGYVVFGPQGALLFELADHTRAVETIAAVRGTSLMDVDEFGYQPQSCPTHMDVILPSR